MQTVITAKDGQKYRVNAPDGTSMDEIWAAFNAQHGDDVKQGSKKSKPNPVKPKEKAPEKPSQEPVSQPESSATQNPIQKAKPSQPSQKPVSQQEATGNQKPVPAGQPVNTKQDKDKSKQVDNLTGGSVEHVKGYVPYSSDLKKLHSRAYKSIFHRFSSGSKEQVNKVFTEVIDANPTLKKYFYDNREYYQQANGIVDPKKVYAYDEANFLAQVLSSGKDTSRIMKVAGILPPVYDKYTDTTYYPKNRNNEVSLRAISSMPLSLRKRISSDSFAQEKSNIRHALGYESVGSKIRSDVYKNMAENMSSSQLAAVSFWSGMSHITNEGMKALTGKKHTAFDIMSGITDAAKKQGSGLAYAGQIGGSIVDPVLLLTLGLGEYINGVRALGKIADLSISAASRLGEGSEVGLKVIKAAKGFKKSGFLKFASHLENDGLTGFVSKAAKDSGLFTIATMPTRKNLSPEQFAEEFGKNMMFITGILAGGKGAAKSIKGIRQLTSLTGKAISKNESFRLAKAVAGVVKDSAKKKLAVLGAKSSRKDLDVLVSKSREASGLTEDESNKLANYLTTKQGAAHYARNNPDAAREIANAPTSRKGLHNILGFKVKLSATQRQELKENVKNAYELTEKLKPKAKQYAKGKKSGFRQAVSSQDYRYNKVYNQKLDADAAIKYKRGNKKEFQLRLSVRDKEYQRQLGKMYKARSAGDKEAFNKAKGSLKSIEESRADDLIKNSKNIEDRLDSMDKQVMDGLGISSGKSSITKSLPSNSAKPTIYNSAKKYKDGNGANFKSFLHSKSKKYRSLLETLRNATSEGDISKIKKARGNVESFENKAADEILSHPPNKASLSKAGVFEEEISKGKPTSSEATEVATTKKAPVKPKGNKKTKPQSVGILSKEDTGNEGKLSTGNKDKKVKSSRHLFKSLNNLFNVENVNSREVPEGVRAYYNSISRRITTRSADNADVRVSSHEIGHKLDAEHLLTGDVTHAGIIRTKSKVFSKEGLKELSKLDYDPKAGRPAEGFAEMFSAMLTDNGLNAVRKEAPTAFKEFTDYLAKNSKLRKQIRRGRNLIRARMAGSDLARAKADIGHKRDESVFEGKHGNTKTVYGILGNIQRNINKYLFYDKAVIDKMTKRMKKEGHTFEAGTSPHEVALANNRNAGSRSESMIDKGLYRTRDDGVQVKFNDGLSKTVFGPLRKAFGGALKRIPKEKLNNMDAYLVAKETLRMAKKNEGSVENALKLEKAGGRLKYNTGQTAEQAQNIIKQLDTGSGAYKEAYKGYTDYMRGLLKLRRDVGNISPEEYKLMTEAHELYVPMTRVVEKGKSARPLKGGGGKVPRMYDQRRTEKGAGYRVYSPLQESIDKTYETAKAISEQESINALVNSIEHTIGLDNVIVQKEISKAGEKLVSIGDIKRSLANKGINVEEIPTNSEEALRAINAMYSPTSLEVGAGKRNTIRFIKDGKPITYVVNDDLYHAFSSLNQDTTRWINLLAKPADIAKLGYVGLSPIFTVRNYVRDLATYAAQTEVAFNPKEIGKAGLRITPIPFNNKTSFGRYTKGVVKEAFNKDGDPIVDMWKMYGGDMSNVIAASSNMFGHRMRDMVDKSAFQKSMNIALHPTRTASNIINITESIPRITEFMTILDRHGYTSKKLAEMAKRNELPPDNILKAAVNAADDVTINFKRAGRAGRALNRIIPFFNPSIQGANKFYRMKDRPAKLAFSLMTTAATTSAYWSYAHNQDWYKEAPTWLRANYYTFGNNKQGYFHIPRTYEYGAISAMTEGLLNSLSSGDASKFTSMFENEVERLNPFNGISAVWPLLQAAMNKDFFTGNKIVSEHNLNLPAQMQSKYNTNPIDKLVGKLVDKAGAGKYMSSPVVWHFLLNQYSGGLYNRIGGLVAGRESSANPVNAFSLFNPARKSQNELYNQSINYAIAEAGLREKNKGKHVWQDNEVGSNAYKIDTNYKMMLDVKRGVLSDIRQYGDAQDTKEDKLEYLRMATGMSRAVLGKSTLKGFPNPIKIYAEDKSKLPKPIKEGVTKLLGTWAIHVTSSKPTDSDKLKKYKWNQSKYLHMLNRLGVSPEVAKDALTTRMKQRGWSTTSKSYYDRVIQLNKLMKGKK